MSTYKAIKSCPLILWCLMLIAAFQLVNLPATASQYFDVESTVDARLSGDRRTAMATSVNPTADAGFAQALLYDQHRSSYPADVMHRLAERLAPQGPAPWNVIDLAAGTGRLTAQLAADGGRWRVGAVEPHQRMREVLLQKRLPGVSVVNGTAAQMPEVRTGVSQAVVIAQGFHWFANQDALKEIRRIITPAGVLLLVWNEEDYNSRSDRAVSTAWEQAMREMAWKYDNKQSAFNRPTWRDVFGEAHHASDGPSSQALFATPLEHETVSWTVWLTPTELWDRFRTLSFIATLDTLESEARKEMFRALQSSDAEMGDGGKIAVHGCTEIFWTRAL